MEHDTKEIRSNYLVLRLLSIFFVIAIPLMVKALTDHQPLFYELILPGIPFFVFSVMSYPPKKLDTKAPYRKAGGILFGNIGALVIISVFTFFYRSQTESYSGGGANIGLGLVMLSMPFVLMVGVAFSYAIGTNIGKRAKH